MKDKDVEHLRKFIIPQRLCPCTCSTWVNFIIISCLSPEIGVMLLSDEKQVEVRQKNL